MTNVQLNFLTVYVYIYVAPTEPGTICYRLSTTVVPMTSVPEEKVPEEETVLVVSFVLNNIEELLLPEISEEE